MFIVITATLGGLALSYSSQNTQLTSHLLLKEQAELLAQGATEYALLALGARDITTQGCLNQITAFYPDTQNPLFNIVVNIYYMGPNLPAGCNTPSHILTAINTEETGLTLLLDTAVQGVQDGVLMPIRAHRRTLQTP
jgi:hypothetical protein